MLGQPWRHHSEKFIFGGWWSGLAAVDVKIGGVHKVDAHKALVDATAEGWEVHWKGNDTADWLAKAARPQIVGAWQAWTKWQRRRKTNLAEALVEAELRPWQCYRHLRKLPRDPGPHAGRIGPLGHVPAWDGRGWSCRKCGARLRNQQAVQTARCSVCPAAFGTKIHASHCLSVGVARQGACDLGSPLALCRACGCYSTRRAVGLA